MNNTTYVDNGWRLFHAFCICLFLWPLFYLFSAFLATMIGGGTWTAIILCGLLMTALCGWAWHEEVECSVRAAEYERRLHALTIADVDSMEGWQFECYVAQLFAHRGYSVEVIGGANDFGVDVIASNGSQRLAIQVKRNSNKVTRKAVSDAVAGKLHYGCCTAMVVTNSYFTQNASDFANSTKCQLVDRTILAEWILDYQNSVR